MGQTRFNKFYQFGVVNADGTTTGTTVTGTNTYNSPITNVNQQHNIGLDVRFLGTMTGTLTVNCSNDGLVFSSLTFDPVLDQPSGSNLNYVVSLNQIPFEYIQVSYVNSSGSGTLVSILTSKDLS